MKTITVLLFALYLTGCTVNYIHGTDVILVQDDQGMESLEARDRRGNN